MELSKWQLSLLKILFNNRGSGHTQIAGHGQAKWLSVARALKNKGLADSYRTGSYYITDAGVKFLKEHSNLA